MTTERIVQLLAMFLGIFSFPALYLCFWYCAKAEAKLFYKENKDDFVCGEYNPKRARINRYHEKFLKSLK